MTLKQTIYDHGGSCIWRENDGKRDLLADTYHTREFAEAVRRFTEEWFAKEEAKPACKVCGAKGEGPYCSDLCSSRAALKASRCELCKGTGMIRFFFDQDHTEDATCPKCSGGSQEKYDKMNERFCTPRHREG